MKHLEEFNESGGGAPSPSPKDWSEMELDDIIEYKFQDQNPRLTSYQISAILRLFKTSIDSLRRRNMNKLADQREIVLKGIINKLS